MAGKYTENLEMIEQRLSNIENGIRELNQNVRISERRATGRAVTGMGVTLMTVGVALSLVLTAAVGQFSHLTVPTVVVTSIGLIFLFAGWISGGFLSFRAKL